MIIIKALLLCLLLVAILEPSDAAFQCYKCNNCGTTWNPNKAAMVFTEGGSHYCTKRVEGSTVIKDYSATCNPGGGLYCCQDELCNSSISQYYMNFGILLAISLMGLAIQRL